MGALDGGRRQPRVRGRHGRDLMAMATPPHQERAIQYANVQKGRVTRGSTARRASSNSSRNRRCHGKNEARPCAPQRAWTGTNWAKMPDSISSMTAATKRRRSVWVSVRTSLRTRTSPDVQRATARPHCHVRGDGIGVGVRVGVRVRDVRCAPTPAADAAAPTTMARATIATARARRRHRDRATERGASQRPMHSRGVMLWRARAA